MLTELFKGRFNANNQQTQQALWSVVSAQDTAKNDASEQALPELGLSSPWYIQFLQSIAAWVASLFTLAFTITFFGLFFDDLDTPFATLAGASYCVVAIAIYRSNQSQQLFVNQMALALSLCGLLSLAYGLSGWFEIDDGIAWYVSFGLVLLLHWLVISHYSHQLIMSFAMIGCAVAICYQLQILEWVPAMFSVAFSLLWLNHNRAVWLFGRLSALGYMLAVWLVLVQMPLLLADASWLNHNDLPILASWSNPVSVMTTLAISLYLLVTILKTLAVPLNSKQAILCFIGSILLALLAIPITGLLSAVLVLVVGFYIGERLILSLGIVGILSFIAWYYYSLQLPLLDKSMWLVGLGVILLLVKIAVTKMLLTPKQAA
ncbi:hypothetical protein TUM4438_44970 [Shewanella sairae]|uniref:DUF4401 domain-containing protein n=1 Tax=Shewanella sairae TaxID=190310 RepID=A0ABQ4PRN5_9GAMM|nr:DUF4401 domain-containing protein [Shewanella sairae]MCL1131951.1 DUF4401 domain-containing protein [Shewanella sairae]GIU52381.1 hypothetical protein TUM4438_44970 [Shewanella sairae]